MKRLPFGRLAARPACWWPLAIALLLVGDVATGRLVALPTSVQPFALLLAGGALSGLLAGLLGIGGALVSIPVLHWVLPALGIADALVPATAVATALMAMGPMTLMAARRQMQHCAIETGWLRRMAAPTALGAAGGALLATILKGPVLALMFALQSLWYRAAC